MSLPVATERKKLMFLNEKQKKSKSNSKTNKTKSFELVRLHNYLKKISLQ